MDGWLGFFKHAVRQWSRSPVMNNITCCCIFLHSSCVQVVRPAYTGSFDYGNCGLRSGQHITIILTTVFTSSYSFPVLVLGQKWTRGYDYLQLIGPLHSFAFIPHFTRWACWLLQYFSSTCGEATEPFGLLAVSIFLHLLHTLVGEPTQMGGLKFYFCNCCPCVQLFADYGSSLTATSMFFSHSFQTLIGDPALKRAITMHVLQFPSGCATICRQQSQFCAVSASFCIHSHAIWRAGIEGG